MVHRMSITNKSVRGRFEFRVYDTLRGMRIGITRNLAAHPVTSINVKGVSGKRSASSHLCVCDLTDCGESSIYTVFFLAKEYGIPALIESAAHEIRHGVDFFLEEGWKLGRLKRGKWVKQEAAAILSGSMMREFYVWAIECKYNFEEFVKHPEPGATWHEALWKEVK